jgi:hypothetical protein
MKFPRDAQPHEIAILEKLLIGWAPKVIQHYYRYEKPSSVYRVRSKYTSFLVKYQVCP